MITKFKNRLKEIHISSVNTQSKHEPITIESLLSFIKIAEFIPENIPIILESPVTPDKIESEMDIATHILMIKTNSPTHQRLEPVLNFINA